MKDAWLDLANAIVQQAARDYIVALKKLKRNPGNGLAAESKKELERFFRSSWYEELTDIDGDRLMKMLQKEIELYDGKGILKSGVQTGPKDQLKPRGDREAAADRYEHIVPRSRREGKICPIC